MYAKGGAGTWEAAGAVARCRHRGILDAIEAVSQLDVPDKIAGVTVPNPRNQRFFTKLTHLVEGAAELNDMVDRAGAVREVLADGMCQTSNCWITIESTRDVIDNIQARSAPLANLLAMDCSKVDKAKGVLNRETVHQCVAIVTDVLDLGKLLKRLASLIDLVRQAFRAIQDFCGDIIEKLMKHVPELVHRFAEALGFGGALDGVVRLLSGIAGVVTELLSISGILRPVLYKFEHECRIKALASTAVHYRETKSAWHRFWPAWEESKAQYALARDMGEQMSGGASQAWYTYKPMFSKLCDKLGRDAPDDDDDALDEMARPSVKLIRDGQHEERAQPH